MKLLFSLPFCFLLAINLYGQGVKKAASGEEHADTVQNTPFIPINLISSTDSTKSKDSIQTSKKDTIPVVPKKSDIANGESKPVASNKKEPESTNSPYKHSYPVPYYLCIGLSANSYRGDLSSTYSYFTPSFHLGIKLNRGRWLNGYFGLSIGQVAYSNSVDTGSNHPNTAFNTFFFTADYELQINIIKNKLVTIYAGAGIGFMYFNPLDPNNNNASLINQSQTRASGESYSNNSFYLPVFVGAIFSLKNYWALQIQAGLLNQTTPYIDNINQLSTNKIGDNILSIKFGVLAPLKINKN
jgi:hypothetical protein